MAQWLERREKIIHHSSFIQWRIQDIVNRNCIPHHILTPRIVLPRQLKMTKHPSRKSVRFTEIEANYGAMFFRDALARYLISFFDPNLSRMQVEQRACHFALPFRSVPVFHKIKFTSVDPYPSLAKRNVVETVVD
jgi:hypothetical protein